MFGIGLPGGVARLEVVGYKTCVRGLKVVVAGGIF